MFRPLSIGLVLTLSIPAPAQLPKPALPRILLIGDSIRVGYAPMVTKKLAGGAEVISPAEAVGDTTVVVKNLDTWLALKPAVVHINSGLHDLKVDKQKMSFQVP